MKRIIVDYTKLNDEILNLIVEKYPDGYDYENIISFKNSRNETVDAIEIRTDEIMYLVKVGVRLEEAMENYIEEEDDEDDEDDDVVVEEKGLDLDEIVEEDDFDDK